MPAIQRLSPHVRDEFVKRSNWAGENPGVILVFCIVFIVGVGVVSLFAYRMWMKRKAKKESYQVQERK
ncbi:hypothetical protein BDV27DRAFT_119178 [Aspergillus caelatus]|uniref:Uncharacterized protein n=1 Tax=Aspergillus caelatus TaxID=61420 RepID=A0A5N7AM69_9EURO|nr:uncharacterized protein BDV27DRAFT_119178 [Aspergillus caelatus]KAE8370925.1 hypothetical protein BDV27DRAFT_119178 [Aspergillus caelatus]